MHRGKGRMKLKHNNEKTFDSDMLLDLDMLRIILFGTGTVLPRCTLISILSRLEASPSTMP